MIGEERNESEDPDGRGEQVDVPEELAFQEVLGAALPTSRV